LIQNFKNQISDSKKQNSNKMKKIIAIALLLSATGIISCNKDSKVADDTQKTNDILPRGNGHFLMYYYPTSSIFNSDNGKEFVKKDTCIGYPTYICADADGVLYSSVMSKKVTVTKSTDGGKTWQDVATSDPEQPANAQYVIAAGKSKTIYALSSNGSFFVSHDGGAHFDKGTTPCKKDTIHSSPAFGMEGWLAVSADGKKIIAQAWYFEETVLSVSSDEGKTWTSVTPPTQRNESRGVGFCGDRIIYASYDQLFRTDDMGKTWQTSTPEKMLSPNCESSFYGYRNFVTDGDQFVVGVEVPSAESSHDDKNKYPGAVFYSHDGGKTFETHPFPYSTDPTPGTSDEYVYLVFVAGK
jgi:Neuraminidase (sialidase)